MVRVGDLVDENGCIMDYNGFNNKYHTNYNILMYYKVVKAIPNPWLIEIEKYVQTSQVQITSLNHCFNIACNEVTADVHKASTKTISGYFIKRKWNSNSYWKMGNYFSNESRME